MEKKKPTKEKKVEPTLTKKQQRRLIVGLHR